MKKEKVKEEIEFQMTAICSKCKHHGILYIKDEDMRKDIRRHFWKIVGMITVTAVVKLMAASFLLGIAFLALLSLIF